MKQIAWLLLGAALFGCGEKQESVDSVAIVGGQPITRQEFVGYLERKPTVTVLTAQGQTTEAKVAGSLGLQALRDLVGRRVMADLARKQGVYPTEQDVDKELAFRSKDDPNFVKALEEQGMSEGQIRDDVTMDLIQERLWTKGVTVADSEVDAFIEKNPRQFQVPPQVSLQYIVVQTPQQRRIVDQALLSGQSFRSTAQSYSLAVGPKETKADFPEHRLDRLSPNVRKLIEATPEMQATKWFQDGSHWVKVYVEKKTAASKVPITDVVREKIRRMLAQQKGRQKNDVAGAFRQALEKADVRVEDETLRPLWQRNTPSVK